MNAPHDLPIKLTSFSHGGGCGCKIAPSVLAEILKNARAFPVPEALLVGIETSDDAAVYQIGADQALVATTDFFMPIVDDPYDFGRIAATNAISDVYAMGGKPIFALAIVAMPIDRLPVEDIARIIEGGDSICRQAGIPIAGGHTIDSIEPIYGLVVIGLVPTRHIKRNSGALARDVLVLGKPLGAGILAAALKKGTLSASGYATLISSTTQLNTPGMRLAQLDDVHAMTDVTGFGLLGHALEMCRGARLGARLHVDQIALMPEVLDFAESGTVTGASNRNWSAYGSEVLFASGISQAWRAVLTDPQTSGGLLVACTPSSVDAVMAIFREEWFDAATVIGTMFDRPGLLEIC